jgi:phenylalanyl-tRNA synthetase alpha subunit
MSIEALKKQLAEGTITQEQFAAELKKLLDAGSITQEEHDAALKTDPGQSGGGAGGALTAEQVQAMIAEAVKKAEQSAGDKVRTEYAAKLKAEQEEKERLLKEKMSDEEKAKFEKEKFEKELKEREAAIVAKEVQLHTINKLTDAKLPISFKEFLVGPTIEDADKNIAAFQTAWQTAIKAEVDAKFKQNGGDPGKGQGGGAAVVNPWKQETFNLTKQAHILRDDPVLAKQLQAQAGV